MVVVKIDVFYHMPVAAERGGAMSDGRVRMPQQTDATVSYIA